MRHVADQPSLNVQIGMGKRTEFFVAAELTCARAKLSFVLLFMVKAFDSTMSINAFVAVWAFTILLVWAHVRRVKIFLSHSVHLRVVEVTMLVVVLVRVATLLYFKSF